MLAPKFDKGQIGSDAVEGNSSSEIEEYDTPLAVRLNSQGTSRRKEHLRPIKTKIAGFVIPRRKKQANELLQFYNFNSREGKEILRNVQQSYRDPNVGATFKFEKLELVHNDHLSREFQERKQCMKNESRNPRELEDKHAFLYTLDRNEAKKICEVGLQVGSTSLSCLGDPSMGVYLCRHADVICRKPLPPSTLGYLIVFKVIKGKVKPVTERTCAASTNLLEPTPNFDCHVSRSIQSLSASAPLSQVFEYSQYYFYEFAEEGDDLHAKRPRQCLPYALLTFRFGNATTVQELSVPEVEMANVDNNGPAGLAPSVPRQDTRLTRRSRGRSSHVLWMGKIANKDKLLSDAQLVCHSLEKVKLPFDIGEKIVMKEKISFQQLRPFLSFPLFRAGPPSVSKTCKVSLAGGTSFLHCDVVPVEDDHGKIQKLVKFFQDRNWAGIVKCPDANRVMFLIPTSQITLDLGITTVDSPGTLHALLFLKNLKASKGTTVTRAQESREIKTVSQIQDELKRQFSDVKEERALAEQKRMSLESVPRPKLTTSSTSSGSKILQVSYGADFEKELTNEQVASWRDVVQKWVSRPNPLGGTAELKRTPSRESSSIANAPKPRTPAVVNSLNASTQNVRSSSRTVENKGVPLKCDGGIVPKQMKSDSRAVKQVSQTPAAPLLIHKEQHRHDPRLKRHSLDSEPSAELKSYQPPVASHSMPYNAQEALQAQGVVLASTSNQTSTTSVSTASAHSRYQVNIDQSLRNMLDNMKLSSQKQKDSVENQTKKALAGKMSEQEKQEGSGYHEAVDDEARKDLAEKMSKQQGSGYQVIVDEGANKALAEKLSKQPKQQGSGYQATIDEGARKALTVEMLKQQQQSKQQNSEVRHTTGKSITSVMSDDDSKSTKNVKEASLLPVQEKSKEQNKSKKEKRQFPTETSENKKAKLARVENGEKQGAVSESHEKSVASNVVPELSEDSFPAITSKCFETLKSPSCGSNRSSKAPKLKLILSKNKAVKEISAQPPADSSNLLEHKLPVQPGEKNAEQDEKDKSKSDDIKEDIRSTNSPVAMDISPVRTTPDPKIPVSPITVVSSKGRYNQAVSPTVTPTSAGLSSPPYLPPVSQSFPFSPPIQGPYRSPISAVIPPMPFPSSSASTSSVPVSSPLGALPMPSVPSSVSAMSFIPPVQTAPVPSLPPPSSPSFPVPSSQLHAANIQRKNGTDSLGNVASSSPVSYPPALPGQQWKTHVTSNQGFGFHQPFSAPQRPNLPPAVAIPPVISQFGGPPQASLPRPPTEVPAGQPQGLGFIPVTGQRLPVLLAHSQGTPFVLPQASHSLPSLSVVTGTPPIMLQMTPQMTPQIAPRMVPPVAPVLGAQPHFMPYASFQQPAIQRPVGFWAAPLLNSHVGLHTPRQPPGKRQSKDLKVIKSSPQMSNNKNVVGGGKPQKNDQKENSEKSSDGHPEENTHVQELSEDKPSAQSEKSKQAVVNESGRGEENNLLENPEATENGSLKTADVEELSLQEGNDLDKSEVNEVCLQKSEKRHLDSVVSTDQAGDTEVVEDSITQGSNQGMEDGDVSMEAAFDGLQPSDVALSDNQTCKLQETTLVFDALPTNKTDDFNISRSSVEMVDACASFIPPAVTDYLTKAEQESIKAKSKVFDILRNASDSRSETESTAHGEEEPDEPYKHDDLEFEPDADMDEGVAKEERLLFSGEESTTSEHGVHLGSGLRVVQVLDLGESENEKEKDKLIPESSSVVSEVKAEDGSTEGKWVGELPKDSKRDASHPKCLESSRRKSSEWEDISDASDEGTPERDLPDFGSVDIEFKQLWPEMVETTIHNDSGLDVPLAPPELEVARVEADSSASTTEKSSRVIVTAQKRRRAGKSEDSDSDNWHTPPRRARSGSLKKKRHRESPDRKRASSSAKKPAKETGRPSTKHKRLKGFVICPREVNLLPRVVSNSEAGLQITILRDSKPSDVKLKMEESSETPEKNVLADMEYSDLEDISPGRLSSENERPATPDTPETATPAVDFTHPSLGFWAAPLGTNEMAKPALPVAGAPTVTEDLQASAADVLPPVTHYLDDQAHAVIEQSHAHYSVEEGSLLRVGVQEPFVAQATWPAEEGFFCQTTTSEERDLKQALADQSEVLNEDRSETSYLIDDTVDRYHALSSHASEVDTSRYAQEFPKSEVFEYGHGKNEHQTKAHRNTSHTDVRSPHKGSKHRSTTRVSRYPWISQKDKHGHLTSTAGEGLKSSVTGRSTGSEASRPREDDKSATKRCKLEKGAHSRRLEISSETKTASEKKSDKDSAETDKLRNWEIMVFAWLNKQQLSNWVQRKQDAVNLAEAKGEKMPKIYTAEVVRRSSERLLRRVKMRIRQSSRSSSKSPVSSEMQTADGPDFEFDEANLESDSQNVCTSKLHSHDSTFGSVYDVNDPVEGCTVNSNEHPSVPGDLDSDDVHKDVQINAADACKENGSDLICDTEVSRILEGRITEQPLSEALHYEGNDEVTTGQTGLGFKELSDDPSNHCKDIDVAVSCESVELHGQEKALEDSAVKFSSGSGKIVEGEEQITDLNENRLTGESLKLDKDSKESVEQITGVERSTSRVLVLSLQDTPNEDVREVHQSAFEGTIANDGEPAIDMVENARFGKDSSLLGKLDDKEEPAESVMHTEKSTEEVSSSAATEARTKDLSLPGKSSDIESLLPESSSIHPSKAGAIKEKESGDTKVSEHQPGLDKQKLEDKDLDKTFETHVAANKAEGTLNTSTSQSPPVETDLLSHYPLTARVSAPEGPRVPALPSQQWPQSTLLTTPMGSLSSPITTHYSVLPPPPMNFMWPGVPQPGPPTAGIVPGIPNNGFLVWTGQPPHEQYPVRHTQSAACNDICPPGTEDGPLIPSTEPPVVETRDVHENTDANQPHGNVMDHSVVTALMQFYSEISEVDASDNNEKDKSDVEVNISDSVPKPQELEQMTGCKVSDMDMESDFDGSHMDVSDMDISEMEDDDRTVSEGAISFFRRIRDECSKAEVESSKTPVKQDSAKDMATTAAASASSVVHSAADSPLAGEPAVCSTLDSTVDAMQIDHSAVSRASTLNPAPQFTDPCDSAGATQMESLGVSGFPGSAVDFLPLEGSSIETPNEIQPLNPIDPVFLANAEHTIFSSMGDLANLLGKSSSFDLIAKEAIISTVSSLEEVLRQAQNSYLEFSGCPSDSGVSTGEETSVPSRLLGSVPAPMSPVQGSAANEYIGTSSYASEEAINTVADKQSTLKKPQKPRKKFQFYVYAPEYDRECEAVKNYMLKAGGTFVDIKDVACLEEHSWELKVLIRRKHLPSVHRLANFYQLKMSPCVKFALFNSLVDVAEGSRLYENVFVSGGALLADDIILKTVEIDHLDGLLRYMKQQSLLQQKFVWVLNISRNGYKRLSMSKPLTKRDSRVLNLLRRYKDEGFITVLPKGYVTEGIPATQRYLLTSRKLQIELSSVYRHIILLSDMNKSRVEVPWFLERGIGVMNVKEFLTTFAGENEARNLLAKQPPISEAHSKETATVVECFTPEDETGNPTPDGTPVSDGSTDSPITDTHSVHLSSSGLNEQPRSAAYPVKRAVRSLSWDPSTMTQTRLQILSRVRSVRENIRSQISNSSPSSPSSRSM